MSKYARRVDANHATIRQQLQDIPGMAVLDVSALPGLGCDLIAFCRGKVLFVEIKAGPKAPLTESERRLQGLAGERFVRAVVVEDVLRALG